MRRRRRLKRGLNSDSRALEGLPLQLLIIMVVLAIGIPAVYTSVMYYDTQNMIQKVENQVEYIEEKAKMMRAYGPGNSDVITVDLEPGMFRDVQYLELGNRTFTNLIQWKIEGGHTGLHTVGDISLISRSGEAMRLGSGSHQLRMESKSGDPLGEGEEMLYIEISLK
ncbi:MAG: hypothetical protein V5A88_03150 [Candidatus Thermoplasmatota archaeon]